MQRGEIAVRIERQRGLDIGIPRMIVGEKMLGAGAAPLDRPADRLRGKQDGDVLRHRLFLDAESSADVVGQHAHPFARQSKTCWHSTSMKYCTPWVLAISV